MKKRSIIIILIIVVVVIIFFSFFWPLDNEDDIKGTIGGVERAEKYRGDQLAETDLLVENEKFVAFTQSAEWQNALKNKELIKLLESDEFARLVSLNSEFQLFGFYNQFFQAYYNVLETEPELTPGKALAILQDDEFHKTILSQDFEDITPEYGEKNLDKFAELWNIEMIELVLFSDDLQLVEYATALQNLYGIEDFKVSYSQDFQNVIVLLSQNLQIIPVELSQDFQNEFLSQEFQKMFAFLQDYQRQILFSQDFHNLILNQDFKNVFFGNDVNPSLIPKMMQDFQKLLWGREFI
jgi:hypothetical protein